jgi:tetratricopeptide (TPR) repeat protein
LAKKGIMSDEKAWDGVLKEARKLQQLANDILDASRIESGSIQYNYTKEKINLLLESIADSVRSEVPKDVTLDVVYDKSEVDLEIEVDRSRISQVITNLLSNSIKFTEKGAITLESKTFPIENKIEIRVRDTGKGLSEGILPVLFEKFATKGHGNVQNHKGTGLGLYLSKAIINAHGGEISASNNENGGATFLINIPISQSKSNIADADSLNLKGMNLAARHELKSALEYFEQAIRINPNHSKAWYNKGMSLFRLGESREEALRCFEKALEINPLDAEAWNNKGAVLAMSGKDKDALTSYNRALDLKPGYSKAWQNKGMLLLKLGNKRDAKECFAKGVESSQEQ